MRVTVRLGEPLWRQAGVRTFELDLAPEATVADALREVEIRFPDLLGGDVPPTAFVGDSLVERDWLLVEGATLTLVWAVAGG